MNFTVIFLWISLLYFSVIVYRCEAVASSCASCMSVNASLACGWCQEEESCTPRSLCNRGNWIQDTCPHEMDNEEDLENLDNFEIEDNGNSLIHSL